jgi:hypothetical protein
MMQCALCVNRYNVMNSLVTPSTLPSLRQKVIIGTMCSALPCMSLKGIPASLQAIAKVRNCRSDHT